LLRAAYPGVIPNALDRGRHDLGGAKIHHCGLDGSSMTALQRMKHHRPQNVIRLE
jgi:hypothetical protein